MMHEPNKAFQIMGGICPGGICLGGKCPGGTLVASRVMTKYNTVSGVKCPRGYMSGGGGGGGGCPVTVDSYQRWSISSKR